MTSEFPDWASFTPARAAADLPRLLAESETAVAALETASPTTFEGFVWRLDDATRELGRCWGAVAHMLSVANAEAWRKVERDAQPKIVAFHLRVGQSRRLYELAKACLALASAGISMSMVNQGSSEVSFMLAIRRKDRDMAVRALYKAFFG